MSTRQKYFILSAFLIMIIASCVSTGDAEKEQSTEKEITENPYPGPPEIYPLLLQWEQAIRTRDMELIKELMPDPNVIYINESYDAIKFTNYSSIETFRFDYYDSLGPYENYSLLEFIRYLDTPNYKTYHFDKHPTPETSVMESFGFGLNKGRWILHEIIYIENKIGPCVTNHLAALADTDNDGKLTGEEWRYYGDLLKQLFSMPHDVATAVDDFFDSDNDGKISQQEITGAAEIMIGKGLPLMQEFAGQDSEKLVLELDKNGNEHIDDEEIEYGINFLSGIIESSIIRNNIIDGLTLLPMPDFIFQSLPRKVETYIDKLGDSDDNGWIDEIEQKIIESGLLNSYHSVDHYFDNAIDRNKDGIINWNETIIILQASAKDWGNIMLVPPPYPTHTPIDKLLDTNSDGLIDDEEIKTHVILFSGQAAAVNFISPELKEILDIDGSGTVGYQEIQKVKAEIFYPREVNPENALDAASDVNSDNFVDVIEIGILAGSSSGTPVTSFDDRIELYRTKSEYLEEDSKFNSTFQENKEKMSNIHLAVLDLKIEMSSLDEKAGNILTCFVENAFVNLGSVTLVERRNMEELYEEIEFQLSDMVDPQTAVRLGMMAGADVIAIGEISELEGFFFLNIKVIDVETAEILGSSIDKTDNPEGFLDLANNVVRKLF